MHAERTALPEHLIVRTARKTWACEDCGREIPPGEKYLEYLGESAAYQSGSRYCDHCAENVWDIDRAYFYPADFKP